MDEAALRALVAEWNKLAAAHREAGRHSVPLDAKCTWDGVAFGLEHASKQLEALLHARSTDESEQVYEVRCADPDCQKRFLLPEPKPDPWYCPRCWQRRGSKESER